MKPLVKFDCETKCDVPIEYGRHVYLNHMSADIKCIAYKVGQSHTILWKPGGAIPPVFAVPEAFQYAAFNIQYDQAVINILGERYGFPKIPLQNCTDIMAVAARYGLPQSLDKLGAMLKVKLPKMRRGKYLIKTVCTPPYAYTKEELKELYAYCVRDVDCMDEIMDKMPADRLSPREQKIWENTATVNNRGVPIDYPSVIQINKIVEHYIKKQQKYLPYYTDGAAQTIGQIEKIKDWVNSKTDLGLENLQANTVDEVLGTGHLPENVEKVLKMRQLIGGAAVKKYRRLKNMVHKGAIHDNLRYHGAGTGRCTGGGFQLLNMPRAKQKATDDKTYDMVVEEVIATFNDVSVLKHPDPCYQAKTLIRPMLKAPDAWRLLVADWSSIEYILNMVYSGEWEKVEAFRDGEDPYIAFATVLFGVPYALVTGDQRQKSKAPILGGQYTLGWKGLQGYAEGYGVTLKDDESKLYTNTFRGDHPMVVQTWDDLKTAAHDAVKNPGTAYITHDTEFIVIKDRTGRYWLQMKLPSGRSLFYCDPRIGKGKFGDVIKHMGIDPYTKKWGIKELGISRIIENVIQGLGRDILEESLVRLKKEKFFVIGTVYDEVICLAKAEEAEEKYKRMVELMVEPPKWMPDLPVMAEGYISKRYKKD